MKLKDEIKHCVESMIYLGNYQSVTFKCTDKDVLEDLGNVLKDNYSTEVIEQSDTSVKLNLYAITDISVEYTVLVVGEEQHLNIVYKDSDCQCSECGEETNDYIKVYGEMVYPTYEGLVGKLSEGSVLCVNCLEHQHTSMDNTFNIDMYNKSKIVISGGKPVIITNEYMFVDTETILDSKHKSQQRGSMFLNPLTIQMYPSISSDTFIRCENNCVIVNGNLEHTKNGETSVIIKKEDNCLTQMDYASLLDKVKGDS